MKMWPFKKKDHVSRAELTDLRLYVISLKQQVVDLKAVVDGHLEEHMDSL